MAILQWRRGVENSENYICSQTGNSEKIKSTNGSRVSSGSSGGVESVARINVLRQFEEYENDYSAAISAKELKGFRKVIGWEHDLRKQTRFKRRRLNSADQEEEVKNQHGAEEENKHIQKGPCIFEPNFKTVPRVLSQAHRRSPTPLAKRAFQSPLYASWKELIGPGIMLPCDGGAAESFNTSKPSSSQTRLPLRPTCNRFYSSCLKQS